MLGQFREAVPYLEDALEAESSSVHCMATSFSCTQIKSHNYNG